MTIVFFEINQLHSLGYRQMITKEKIYEEISLRVQLSYNNQHNTIIITDVLEREFPICDIAGG